jgi:hypothetical protein
MRTVASKVVVLALTCGVALLPSAARAANPDQQFDCETWKGKEWRCLFYPDRGGPTATVKVSNGGQQAVAFDVSEWHSLCDFPGGQVANAPVVLAAGSETTLPVLCPGSGITCREVFIVNCRVNGVPKNCSEVVSAKGYTWKGNKQ